ncbi:hypothetical protein GUJ93_ZPchr0001g32213 [Zizania palustris]|uniref:Uncharacterized protein n=1 Tax=Zizania palustris TaxID=103762 RepID=A0A8J5VS27_ZIZPA|nr:hypothetical protein GUJ93_ZPchr0001g32213 [Zizania palustris]
MDHSKMAKRETTFGESCGSITWYRWRTSTRNSEEGSPRPASKKALRIPPPLRLAAPGWSQTASSIVFLVQVVHPRLKVWSGNLLVGGRRSRGLSFRLIDEASGATEATRPRRSTRMRDLYDDDFNSGDDEEEANEDEEEIDFESDKDEVLPSKNYDQEDED